MVPTGNVAFGSPDAPDYDDGWYSYVVQGPARPPRHPSEWPWSCVYCGQGSRKKCAAMLQRTSAEAIKVTPEQLYGGGNKDCAHRPEPGLLRPESAGADLGDRTRPLPVREPADLPAGGDVDAAPAALSTSRSSPGPFRQFISSVDQETFSAVDEFIKADDHRPTTRPWSAPLEAAARRRVAGDPGLLTAGRPAADPGEAGRAPRRCSSSGRRAATARSSLARALAPGGRVTSLEVISSTPRWRAASIERAGLGETRRDPRRAGA